ncbi:hypothetical protein [Aquimarina algicola]|uniref:DUF4294 domain-containing protein n=1 Tax=Aquimarina algicola TaxID=2589995 RepID=A0A504JN22_9FLAO|nr:hypothetical protein [Aquimarina algicola]TPN89093.1 hypothetical protein FHK87_02410 [Aquimarina algicola]
MRAYFYFIFLLGYVSLNAQSASRTHVIYESKDQIVINNGESYQIVDQKPFFEVHDATIRQYKNFKNYTLRLNRVVIVKNQKNDLQKQLVEWQQDNFKYYELRDIATSDSEKKKSTTANF